jgi:hypothetical protein
VPLRTALAIGAAQVLSMIPGTSRSGATIMGALAMGLTPAAAAEFSFFLSIPTMFAAGGYSLLKHLKDTRPDQFVTLGVGFVVSFIVAWLVVKVFMRFIQTHRFTSFAIYRIILGVIVLGYFFVERGRARAVPAGCSESADEREDQTQVPALQRRVLLRPPQLRASEVLLDAGLPASLQGVQPAAVAESPGEPRLLPRNRKLRAGQAVAPGQSRPPAQQEGCAQKCVTRTLDPSSC